MRKTVCAASGVDNVDGQARARCTQIGNWASAIALVSMPTVTMVLPLLAEGDVIPREAAWGCVVLALWTYLAGLYCAFRHHRRWSPVWLGTPGSLLIFGSTARTIPEWMGWGAVGLLVVAWSWNMDLHRRDPGAPCEPFSG